jgi:hypothetical protein
MTDADDDLIASLRLELVASASISDATEQMLEVASIVQELLAPLGLRPVVVGGLALACWLAGDTYLTSDIDVVMPWSSEADLRLRSLGFEREGRFWVLPDRKQMLEAPESGLRPEADGYDEVGLKSGRSVLVQNPEGVLLIRMEELSGAPHSEVFEQYLWLLGSGEVDLAEAGRLAGFRGLERVLKWLLESVDNVESGEQLPQMWEISEQIEKLTGR